MAVSRFTEKNFFRIQKLEDQRWFIGLALAFLLHAALAGMLLFMSPLFESTLPFEEAVIVSVTPMADMMPTVGEMSSAPNPSTREVKAPEPGPTKPEPPPPPKEKKAPEPKPEKVESPPEPKVSPEPVRKTAPAPEPEPQTTVAAQAPVSLAPTQRKKKIAQDTRLQEERDKEQRREDEKRLSKELEQRQKQMAERIRKDAERKLAEKVAERKREAERKQQEEAKRQAAADARRREAAADARQAEAEAQRAAADARRAREELASMRDNMRRQTGAFQSDRPQAATGRQDGNPAIESQYWSLVAQRLRGYWKLPEGRNWNASLLAKVVITINSDGSVARIAFDEHSTDPMFDQLVQKTIRQASPMPRFPAIMRQSSTQVGFRFKPGGLGNI